MHSRPTPTLCAPSHTSSEPKCSLVALGDGSIGPAGAFERRPRWIEDGAIGRRLQTRPSQEVLRCMQTGIACGGPVH